MRIIGGRFKGRSIRTGEGPGYRPATGKVREALFSMLEARGVRWPGLRVVDVFAGSGALGFEALSRGAASVLFVENDANAAAIIRKNIELLAIDAEQARVAREEARAYLRRKQPWPGEPFGLCFVDPPYEQNMAAPVIRGLVERDKLAPGAMVAAEVEQKPALDSEAMDPRLETLVDRHYGQTRILVWEKTS